MKKINKRSISGVYIFTCDNCLSEFKSDEYIISRGRFLEHARRSRGFFKADMIKRTDTPVWVLSTECPVCKEGVRKEFPTGEPAEITEFEEVVETL